MDPNSVNTASFTLTGPAPAATPVTASSVVVDGATGRIASFTPANPLSAGVTYTATLRGGASGVRDTALPANPMANDLRWTFSVGPSSGKCVAAPTLGAAAVYGDVAARPELTAIRAR